MTSSGAPLPLVAQPQDDLLTVNVDDIPILKDSIAPGIHIQPLRLDPDHGQAVLIATVAPGAALPIHYHTGTAEVYTFQGSTIADAQEVLALAGAGLIRNQVEEFPFEKVEDAYERLAAGTLTGRAVVVI